MPKGEVSRVIKASRGKVWEVFSDRESRPKWGPDTKSVKILERKGNTVTDTITKITGGKEYTMGGLPY